MNLPFWLYYFTSQGWILGLVLTVIVIFVLRRGSRRSQRDHLDSVARYLGDLLRREKLSRDEYHRLREILEEDYRSLGHEPSPNMRAPRTPTPSKPVEQPQSAIISQGAGELPSAGVAHVSAQQPLFPPRHETESGVGPSGVEPNPADLEVIDAEVVETEVVEPSSLAPATPATPPHAPLSSEEATWVARNHAKPTASHQTAPGGEGSLVTAPAPQPSRPLPWEDPPDYQPPAPRTNWAELLQGFMRENNIRWGELLSGILIIGSAVGLVISLRHELRETVPYFPAFLFLLVTAAIHGAGAYTLKQWKLPGTSRGVLLIGLLLVPLNFFTASLLMGQPDQDSVSPALYWSSLGVGATIFAGLTYASSTMLFRSPAHWFVTATIIGCSLWQVPLYHGVSDGSPPLLVQTIVLPLSVLFLVGLGGVLRGHRSPSLTDEAKGEATIMAWGVSSFAFVTACTMLAVAQRDLQLTLSSASSSLLPAVGLGWIMVGGWLHREADIRGWQLITGLAISLVGTALMLGSLAAAWPSPFLLIAAAVVTSAAGFGVSRHFRLSWLFPVALGQAAVGFVVAWHLILERFGPYATGNAELSWPVLISPRIAAGLTAYAALLGSIGFRWATRGTSDTARLRIQQVLRASLVSAIFSGALAIVGGTMAATGVELGTAAAVLMLNAFMALIAGGILEHRGLLRVGSGLLLIGTLFAVQSQPDVRPSWELGGEPIPVRLFIAGMFVIFTCLPALVLAGLRQVPGISQVIGRRLQMTAMELSAASAVVSMGSSVLALPLSDLTVGWLAVNLAAVSLSLGIQAWQDRGRAVNELLKLSVIATSMVTATAVWFERDANAAWQAPFHLALQLVVLSGLLFVANGTYALRRRIRSVDSLVSISCEIGVAMLLAGGLFLLAIFICLPGITAEFGVIWRATESRAWLIELAQQRLLWFAWALTCAASALGLRTGERRLHGSGMLVLATSGLLLLAALLEPSASTASAIRWLTTPALLIWLVGRLAIQDWNRHRNEQAEILRESRHADRDVRPHAREQLWVGISLGGLPTLLLMTTALLCASLGYSFAGPNDPWFFGRLIPEINYGAPLLIGLAATLVAAWHERERWFARAGFVGLVLLVAVWLVAGIFIPNVPNRASWIIGYSHASAIILTLFGWGWIPLERKLATDRDGLLQSSWLRSLLATVFGTALTPPLVALLLLLVPGIPWREFTAPVAQFSGWVAFLFAGSLFGVLVWRSRVGFQLAMTVMQNMLLALLGLTAATIATTWPLAPEVALGVLMFGLLLCAALWLTWHSLAMSWRANPDWSPAANQGGLAGTWTAMAFVGSLLASYQFTFLSAAPAPWLLPALVVVLILATWSVSTFASIFAHFGTLAILGSVLFLGSHPTMRGIDLPAGVWFHLFIAAVALFATVVLGIEKRFIHIEGREVAWRDSLRLPPMARWTLIPICGLILAIDLSVGLSETGPNASPLAANRTALQSPWGWLSLASVGLLTLASVWDPRQRVRLGLVHVWGTIFICLLPVQWWVGDPLLVAVLLTVNVYHFLISRLLHRIPQVVRGVEKVRIRDASRLFEHAVTRWSRIVLAITTFTSALAILPVMTFDLRSDRVLSALVPVLAAFSWGSLVPLLESGKRYRVARGAILWFSLTCLLVSLADVAPGIWEPVWLRRLLRIVLVGALLTAIYGAVTSRLLWMEEVWRKALASMTKTVAAIAAASLLLLVFVEIGLKQAGLPLQLSAPEASMVAVALVIMIVGLMFAALAPGQLRLQISDSTREVFVYLTEGVAGLLGIHVLLAMPWLVQPEWRPYWPYGVLALAFAGVGASEVCRRQGSELLSRPLLRTGTLLPVVPFLLMWFLPTGSDYAIVLVGGGLLYFVLAATQSRPLYAAAGTVCGNIALWTILQRTETLEFFRHPQIWLIPPALSVLLAIQFAPSALSQVQKSLLRYLCILVIYVSSTSEIFITGLGDALWPPMILIMLSLLGVALGIALQIRAFLLLGSLFVFVSLLSMVMHAQRSLDHVWPWWAFGIGLGIGILTLLGFLEKKRPELLATLERLKQWEG